MQEYNFKVETKRQGQPRAYADSEYEYEIESDCHEITVKEFCTKMLEHCNQTRDEWGKNSAGSYFHGYYEFSKIGENKYRYYVKKPYTG